MSTAEGLRLPTTRGDWRLMGRTVRLVLTLPVYAAVAVIAAIVSLTLFVVSLNVPLVLDLVVGGSLPLASRLRVLGELYPFVGTSFNPAQGILLVVVAALTGIDIGLVTYHFREHGLDLQQGGAGVAGVVLGTLGAGCAACGSAVLLGLLSLLGVSTSLLFLPLDGLEFALLALAVLTLSIYWLAEGMRGGEINGCPVDI
ncbi:hypothetical protein HISP_12240 [Haloarcula hispanica N601]|uniref:Uncharacterized protein n=2 Tax=Haloarcula hispanica TaxID=51589 RepID=V5TNS1_HALHI|nr:MULTISPECIES: hypothetical protein [Haloarcula]AEM57991.1 conserved hypothetical protein [Haloarcula hispanica ATCC 33960]AHB66738.1 hypothetical protein HISP_12240 [Haloarcula hispanica N601]AJF25038.1 hypothetical protein SG26_04550 [Haloarcula sp. CBA1115]